MKRVLWMSPLLLLCVLTLGLSLTGIPLLRRSIDLGKRLPPGNMPTGEETLSPEATAACRELVESPGSRFHGFQGYWMVVATWLLIPLAACFPLIPAWRGTRRRKTALVATGLPHSFLLLLILLESFSGVLIGQLLRSGTGVVRGQFARLVALHGVGVPVLFVLTAGFLLWVQARLSKRVSTPEAQRTQRGI